jgi:6-phospho-beta-glucosidase
MKLTLIGAGGFRTPVIYRALAAGDVATRYDEVAFYDIDQARLDRIGCVLDGISDELGSKPPVTMTTNLDAAVDGADIVYCAVRAGGMAGRILDETAAIAQGVIGQETTGPGGITFALRTVPVVTSIAEVVARRAPNATFVNFTNPVGLVTEAARRVLGDRVIGICDAPLDLCKRVAGALDRAPEDLWFDYFGINHLGWLRGVLDGGRDVLPGLLADGDRLETFEEGRLFGADWLRSVGMIPNEYLYYFYYNAEALEAMQAGRVRSAFLERQQAAFYAGHGTPAEALRDWRRTHAERESHYMEEAWTGREDDMAGIVAARGPGDYGTLALNLVDGLYGDGYRVMILDVPNRSSLPFLDEEAIVEVPCIIGRGGVVPAAIGSVPIHAQGLILSVRAAERAAIEAALSGSRSMAIKALAMHPLVPSVDVAGRILDGYIAGQPTLVERYGAA